MTDALLWLLIPAFLAITLLFLVDVIASVIVEIFRDLLP